MKKIFILSVSLLFAGSAVAQPTSTLIHKIPTLAAFVVLAGVMGYIHYNDTNPYQFGPTGFIGNTLAPQSRWGAIPPKGFMGGAFAPPAQGAINFLNVPQTAFYKI
jgi:hypothetical protein